MAPTGASAVPVPRHDIPFVRRHATCKGHRHSMTLRPAPRASIGALDLRTEPAAPSSEPSTYRLVCALLEARFDLALDNVPAASHLVRDLKLDPIDVEDLPLALEEAFEIDISNADAGRIETIEDAVRCVNRNRRTAS